jgi:hypothetical protein
MPARASLPAAVDLRGGLNAFTIVMLSAIGLLPLCFALFARGEPGSSAIDVVEYCPFYDDPRRSNSLDFPAVECADRYA